jgi:hypothetical protein
MYSISIPRVSAHYNETDVRDALNKGFDGEFVDTIDVRYTTDSKGEQFQMMFVHFLEKEGNERTVEFFQRLAQNGEVVFYTGASNRKTGQRYFWKIRKNTGKKIVEVPVAVPGLMSEEEEAKILRKTKEPAETEEPKVETEEPKVETAEAESEESEAEEE